MVKEDGDEPDPGGDGPNRPLRGPAARYQWTAEEDCGVRGEEKLLAELHPERAVLHRPAGPTGLHHGGGQRRPLLQPSCHRGDSANGSCKRGKNRATTSVMHLFLSVSMQESLVTSSNVTVLLCVGVSYYKQA